MRLYDLFTLISNFFCGTFGDWNHLAEFVHKAGPILFTKFGLVGPVLVSPGGPVLPTDFSMTIQDLHSWNAIITTTRNGVMLTLNHAHFKIIVILNNYNDEGYTFWVISKQNRVFFGNGQNAPPLELILPQKSYL